MAHIFRVTGSVFFLFVLLMLPGMTHGQEYFQVGGGIQWMMSTVENAAPDPLQAYLHAGTSFSLAPNISVAPEISYNYNYYEYRSDLSYVIPSEHYVLASSFVHLLTLSPSLNYSLPLSAGSGMVFGLSPVEFVWRIPQGYNEDYSRQIDQFFWEEARFLASSLGAGYFWSFNSGLTMGVRLRVHYPLSNLWDSVAPSSLHGLKMEAGFFFRFLQKGKAEAGEEAPVPANDVNETETDVEEEG